jgi:heme/copper-type cytochrome/quinol oxidase subunit 2
MARELRRLRLVPLFLIAWLLPTMGGHDLAAAQDVAHRAVVWEITIRAVQYSFTPARVEVEKGDIVRLTVIAEDIPYGFTIDEYRIAKRVSPGRSITVEFVADCIGRFEFYCGMTADKRCREMRGELIVR